MCFDIDDVLKFDSSEACKGKTAVLSRLGQPKNHQYSKCQVQKTKFFHLFEQICAREYKKCISEF